MSRIVIAAFYKFIPLADYAARRAPLAALAQKHGVFGTILLAAEGFNGTIAGPRGGIDAVLAHLKTFPGADDLQWKESFADKNPFYRMKVRLKKEIVTMGVAGIAPEKSHEHYVRPDDWNMLISDPETVLIDTRNDYEVSIGTFDGAINPNIKSFREFPAWFKNLRAQKPLSKVAMFCTGGIRCEKTVAFLRQQGVDEVYHLQGGILKYLEDVPENESLWRGECFVFDNRVSVGHDLEKGSYDMCHACRMPITQADKASPYYEAGVSCPACHAAHSDKKRRALQERQKQMRLAAARGQTHLGAPQGKHS